MNELLMCEWRGKEALVSDIVSSTICLDLHNVKEKYSEQGEYKEVVYSRFFNL